MKWILDNLTAQIALPIIGALALALVGLSAYVWGVPIIGGGLKAELAEAREDAKAAQDEVDRLVRESDARKATGKRAVEADKPKAEQRAKARTIIQYRESECATPPDIIEALDRGWQR
jgi:hypothetical protein